MKKKLLTAGVLVLGLLAGASVRAADEPMQSEPEPALSDTGVPQSGSEAAQDDGDAAKGEADSGQSEAETVAKGRAILEKNCARCHAIGMDDNSKHEEAPPFRVVVTRYPPEDLAEALAEGIVSGHPDMPEFVFQPNEIEAIIAFLGTLAPPSEGKPPQDK